MDIGPSEAKIFWTEFLRKLARRGLRGVKLVISDAHEGLKAAITKVLHASWQRCRVHLMRNLLAHAGRHGRRVASVFIATAFAQEDAEAAKAQWRKVADQLRPKLPKLAAFMAWAVKRTKAKTDVLADLFGVKLVTATIARLSQDCAQRLQGFAKCGARPHGSSTGQASLPSQGQAWMKPASGSAARRNGCTSPRRSGSASIAFRQSGAACWRRSPVLSCIGPHPVSWRGAGLGLADLI